ncbi:MAG: divalent-cation tolerance protein CutA [Saprospiraceae bacterium]|nr:divalent-cation tolerance protein CutA [Saprospiraceae bacterium]
MPFLVFYVTYPDEAAARRISESLVEQRLAACANIFPIQSVYWWEGAVQQEGEWVSILKTRLGLEDELEKAIETLHPYAAPCIMRFEARANAAYEAWIEACCTPELRSGGAQ